jgi:uncharacterized protein YyaL (SSP411 family)
MGRAVLLAAALGCTVRAAAPAVASAEENPAAVGLAPSTALVTKLAAAVAAKGPDFRPNTRHLDARGRPLFTNRLILETSPYLLQHANNPVSWYAWGDAPFERAQREKKPVLLSIGYSTCHWCHVMERESFEDVEIARYLNENYVAIKVDREERPDVDDVYMTAVELLTGNGGWPMTTVLTPERQPFFGGTYFPARNFLSILTKLKRVYDEEPQRVLESAAQISKAVQNNAQPARPDKVPGPEAIRSAVERLAGSYDAAHGGFGGAPKFPTPANLVLLGRYHRRSGDPQALKMLVHTLEEMAKGGIYDHLGGGFHRYSTDPQWLKPHFEKMLYDNAQLALGYLDGWQLTGRADFARVARETLDYVARDMTDPRGGFFSASDADSPGPGGEEMEGYYFTWTPGEVEAVLGKERARAFEAVYGVTRSGDLDGRSILHRAQAIDEVAAELKIAPAALEAQLETARKQLLAGRGKRPPPAVDRKIVTAWNGLMISAFARTGFALGEARYIKQAVRAAEFLLANGKHRGQLAHTWKDGKAQEDSFLDDYAALAQGLIDLYEATTEPRWLTEAIALLRALDARFRDVAGGYFLTPEGKPGLLAREKPAYDGVIPTGNSIAALDLLRLAELTGDEAFRKRALEVLGAFASNLKSMPAMLGALDWSLDQPLEAVVVRPGADAGEPLLAVLRRAYLPDAVRVIAAEGKELELQARTVPLLESKRAVGGKPTAYVCRKRVCDLPTADPAVFARQLARVEPLFADHSPAPLKLP